MAKVPCNIPEPCQFSLLNLKDDKRIRDEQMQWLPKENDIPIWSRLNEANCLGNSRNINVNKKGDYNIELPSRLWSLWGNIKNSTTIAQQIALSSHPIQFEWVACILALCSALKYKLDIWSTDLLDSIYVQGCKVYQDLLARINLNDANCQPKNLATTYNFRNTRYKVALEPIASGFVYIPYGYNEFNIARAITFFFNNYQFGIICCNSKILAIGYCVDIDDGYFMFDCQSKGSPLFQNNDTTAYVLRCNHLQILLYCLVVTLNVSKNNTAFRIYNVDINIDDTTERSHTARELKTFSKKITTNLSPKKNEKVSPSRLKSGREVLRKIKSNLALGLCGLDKSKNSSKQILKQKNELIQRKIEINQSQSQSQSQSTPFVAKSKELQNKNNNNDDIKENLDKTKRESSTSLNISLKSQNQNAKERKRLIKSRSFHEIPLCKTTKMALKPKLNETETNVDNDNRNSCPRRSKSENDRKIYLIKTKSTTQLAINKTIHPKITVVNQLSELMRK